ncbi:hypothetical protein BJ138DRAFT_292760 [Hygrophoropsis aurantiaca]|uniref:Uncharacterized protein n=1 Tax=Hygrophoropsis aurantiaca TaxID=72124 RepID=A0ACB8ATW9_9AGAM|nr:hypothetical protein BJ138DRAFT_292760 [Hygrophoropsis aurantiaca]
MSGATATPNIVLYDIPGKLEGYPWSPNTMKTRYSLGYKGIPFSTEWIEFPDIEVRMKAIRAKPTSQQDGKDRYTLPTIHDTSTGAIISDSLAIAQYLDETYPDTPALLPAGKSEVAALIMGLRSALTAASASDLLFIFVKATEALNPASQEYYKRAKEEKYGVAWAKFPPAAEEKDWEALEKGWNAVDKWYEKHDGKFLLGDEPCFANFSVGALLKWCSLVFTADEWNRIQGWHGGRWASLLVWLEPYFVLG